MRDLLVITPSRGRPGRLAEMLEACLSLSEADTDIAVALDDDDDASYTGVRALFPWNVCWRTGKRRTLSGWTNMLAASCAGEYRALASLGDDHVPRTQGWDGLLLGALDSLNDTGTGIAYGDDTVMGERLPTAPVISGDIVTALGWMCEPSLCHMCVDLCWKDIGQMAGCLAYVPGVVIEHRHWGAGKSLLDATYAEAEARHQDDRDAYGRWCAERRDDDVAKVRALLKGKAA